MGLSFKEKSVHEPTKQNSEFLPPKNMWGDQPVLMDMDLGDFEGDIKDPEADQRREAREHNRKLRKAEAKRLRVLAEEFRLRQEAERLKNIPIPPHVARRHDFRFAEDNHEYIVTSDSQTILIIKEAMLDAEEYILSDFEDIIDPEDVPGHFEPITPPPEPEEEVEEAAEGEPEKELTPEELEMRALEKQERALMNAEDKYDPPMEEEEAEQAAEIAEGALDEAVLDDVEGEEEISPGNLPSKHSEETKDIFENPDLLAEEGG